MKATKSRTEYITAAAETQEPIGRAPRRSVRPTDIACVARALAGSNSTDLMIFLPTN